MNRKSLNGSQLKWLMNRKDINGVALAYITGLSTLTISHYVRGTAAPKVNTAIMIAQALGTTVERLWDANGALRPAEWTQEKQQRRAV
jgi:DNA-binding XRE family transcriptional regulator